MSVLDPRGRSIGLDFDNILYFDISSTDYDPITTGSTGEGAHTEAYGKGFYVVPSATGYLYAITHRDWYDNGGSFTGLTPKKIFTVVGTPLMVRLVKVIAKNDGTYTGNVTEINIGFN